MAVGLACLLSAPLLWIVAPFVVVACSLSLIDVLTLIASLVTVGVFVLSTVAIFRLSLVGDGGGGRSRASGSCSLDGLVRSHKSRKPLLVIDFGISRCGSSSGAPCGRCGHPVYYQLAVLELGRRRFGRCATLCGWL